jgi:hypothetical protein
MTDHTETPEGITPEQDRISDEIQLAIAIRCIQGSYHMAVQLLEAAEVPICPKCVGINGLSLATTEALVAHTRPKYASDEKFVAAMVKGFTDMLESKLANNPDLIPDPSPANGGSRSIN